MGEWCEVRREHARQRLARVRPATKSTGPRSAKGKRKVAVNFYPPEQREFMAAWIDIEAELRELESIDIEALADPNSEAAQLVDQILGDFAAESQAY